MALINKTSTVNAARSLKNWLATKLGDCSEIDVTNVKLPTDSGLSAETLLFDTTWIKNGKIEKQTLVARVQPSGEGAFPKYDLESEFAVLRALGQHTPVPVPQVLWYEGDNSILGAPFFVMHYIDGRVPADDPPFTKSGWVLDLPESQRTALCENALIAMSQIHAVDWRALQLDRILKAKNGAVGLHEDIKRWRALFDWARDGEENRIVSSAFTWLEENQPSNDEPLVLNWGDARIGNILFAENNSVAGVLDWEMTTMVSREYDLGWWLFLMHHHTEGFGLPTPAGFLSPEQTIARYETLSGHTCCNLEFHQVFAAIRMSIVIHRAGVMMINAGSMPKDTLMKTNNPSTMLLAKMIGEPPPEDKPQFWFGSR